MPLDWVATVFSMTGAVFIANKKWYGYPILLISNIAWILFGYGIGSVALQVECTVYLAINSYGLYYWTKEDIS